MGNTISGASVFPGKRAGKKERKREEIKKRERGTLAPRVPGTKQLTPWLPGSHVRRLHRPPPPLSPLSPSALSPLGLAPPSPLSFRPPVPLSPPEGFKNNSVNCIARWGEAREECTAERNISVPLRRLLLFRANPPTFCYICVRRNRSHRY